MKISARTKQILKNFASINQNVLLSKGNKIRTISPSRTVYAEAEVEEEFPSEFGIYDLNEFLGVISLFTDPDVLFDDNVLTVVQGKNSVRYLPADASVLIAPKKALSLKEETTKFDLELEALGSALKAAAVLKSPIVTFQGNGTSISLIAHDKTNVNSNSFSVEVADNTTEFEFHVKTEFLSKLLAEKFEVKILENKMLVFQGDAKLYIIAAESDSTI
jgi:hypothetical protein